MSIIRPRLQRGSSQWKACQGSATRSLASRILRAVQARKDGDSRKPDLADIASKHRLRAFVPRRSFVPINRGRFQRDGALQPTRTRTMVVATSKLDPTMSHLRAGGRRRCSSTTRRTGAVKVRARRCDASRRRARWTRRNRRGGWRPRSRAHASGRLGEDRVAPRAVCTCTWPSPTSSGPCLGTKAVSGWVVAVHDAVPRAKSS